AEACQASSSNSDSDSTVLFSADTVQDDDSIDLSFDADLFDDLDQKKSGEEFRIYYTNADSLLNKIDELETIVVEGNIDIIVITETFPKSMMAISIHSSQYQLRGFQCFTSNIKENSRGVFIYIRNDIPADYCQVLKNCDFLESVWCEIRLQNMDKILIGAVYKSPNCSVDNYKKLNDLISTAANLNYKKLMILGDFNFPEIDWSDWTVNKSETHPSFLFLECIRDNFLAQHVDNFTRYRDGQEPSCLDLIFTDNLSVVEDIKYCNSLGASDHIGMIFKLPCEIERRREESNYPKFYKGSYEEIRKYLSEVSWQDIKDMNVDDAWQFILGHIGHCIDTYIPKSSIKKGIIKPKWMDYYCLRKLKKKYHLWKRFTFSRSYVDYQEYCRARNQVTTAIRFSKKKYQKGVVESTKKSPKSFWSFIKGETKSKTSIADLKDKEGNTITGDAEKARVLNDFFSSVFTTEGNEELPNFSRKVDKENFIHDVHFSADNVLKILKTLNTSKSCGPDSCHPYFLKECAEELYLPLYDLFDQDQLQNDIDNLCEWSSKWLLKFNIDKCKVVTYGNEKLINTYTMSDTNGETHELTRDNQERDLGILFTSNLNFDQHINNIANKANSIIGLVRRKFTFMNKDLFLTLYKALIRSHLDYGNLVYYPTTKKCKQIIENVQRRATRLVPELKGLTYEERLCELNLTTLEYRRKRYDIIQVYKIVHNIDNIDINNFFTFAENVGTRGHNLKLNQRQAKKGRRMNAFGIRTVSTWNNLPGELVNSTTLLTFKTNLDKLWRPNRFDISSIY
ncbi:YWV1-like protein, partial [Mya arenaria]